MAPASVAQARNWTNATPPGVVGVMKIVREAYIDPFQLDPKSEYYHQAQYFLGLIAVKEATPAPVVLKEGEAPPEVPPRVKNESSAPTLPFSTPSAVSKALHKNRSSGDIPR